MSNENLLQAVESVDVRMPIKWTGIRRLLFTNLLMM